jgi:hypothetical protein
MSVKRSISRAEAVISNSLYRFSNGSLPPNPNEMSTVVLMEWSFTDPKLITFSSVRLTRGLED